MLAVQLMAAKYGLPVWPHAGGVGLCEYAQQLHEHFVDPCRVENGACQTPDKPGFSIEFKAATIAGFTH